MSFGFPRLGVLFLLFFLHSRLQGLARTTAEGTVAGLENKRKQAAKRYYSG
jgi:hypothetical protein